MVTTLEYMSTPKKSRKDDRHKPRRLFALPAELADALDGMAKEQFSTATALIRVAVIRFLKEHDRLPAPKRPPKSP